MRTAYADVVPFTTKDGAEIRELLHPVKQQNRNQSLAEATVKAGCSTTLHRHQQTEEVYHCLAGQGFVTVGSRETPIRPGDTICIPPGTPHRLRALGPEPLRVLCCCAPAYSHEDTELLE